MVKFKLLFKKGYYKYYYNRIKKKKPLDYIFFDFRIFLILLSIFVLGFILFFPHEIKLIMPPVFLQVYILESVLRIISIFVGISFSFIILSFNVFYRYFGRYAFLDFFKIRSAKLCITLLVSTILILLYTISFLKEMDKNISYTDFLYTFSLLLSTVSFFSIFPFFINLLRSSQNRKHVTSLFNKINEEAYVEDKFLAQITDDKTTLYHKDPISLINEIGLLSIREFDNNTFELINGNIASFFNNCITQPEDYKFVSTRELYNNFTDLISDFYDLSIKEKNIKFCKILVNTRFKIEEVVLENIDSVLDNFKEISDKYKYMYLDFDIEKFLKKAVQYNEDEISEMLISRYHYFVSQAMIKLYPENIVYNKNTHFETATQSDIVFEPFRYLISFSTILLNSGKIYLFKEIFTACYSIEQEIANIDTSDETKCFLINVIYNYKKEIFLSYVDAPDTMYIDSSNFPFKNSIHLYENTNCSASFYGLLEISSILLAKNKLNNLIINHIKAEMLHLIRLNDFANGLFVNAIIKFKNLSETIKKEDSDYRKDIYIKLIEKLEIVNGELLKQKDIPDAITNTMTKTIESFNFKTEFKEELQNKNYISDNRIV